MDPRDTEVAFTIAENLRALPQAAAFSEINMAIAAQLEKYDAAQVLDSYSAKIQDVIETEVIPMKETMEKLFPGYND